MGGNESFVKSLNSIFSKLINSQRTQPFVDFTVKNKATLSSPYVICQLCHKEQKSSILPHLITSLWGGGGSLSWLSMYLRFRAAPRWLFYTDIQTFVSACCLELTYKVVTQPPGSSQKPHSRPGTQGTPQFYFQIEFTQFVLNARCLFDVSAAVATLRSHLVSRGQNPRVTDGWMGARPKAQEPTSKKHCSTCDFS